MKKIYLCLLTLGASILLESCLSNNFLLNESTSPLMIMQMSCNTHVPYYSDEVRDDEYGDEDGLISNAINSFLGKNNPEIQTVPDRLTYAEDSFRRLLPENAGVEVLDKQVLFDSPTYKNIGTGSMMSYLDVKYRSPDYKYMDDLGRKKARMICSETGAASLVFINFTFKKAIVDGSNLKGDVAAWAQMDIRLYDKTGKKVVDDVFTTTSSTTTELYLTKYDKEAIVEMFPDLIDELISKFIVKYL